MARKPEPEPDLPLEQELSRLQGSVRRRWLVLGAAGLALCSALAWTGVNIFGPLRRYRERQTDVCQRPLHVRAASARALGEVVALGGARPSDGAAAELVDTGRALFLVRGDGRSELLADRCLRAGPTEGRP